MSASKSGRTDADGRGRPPPPAGTGGGGPRCRIDAEETASKISYRKVRRTSSPLRREGRRGSEPNLCISLLPPSRHFRTARKIVPSGEKSISSSPQMQSSGNDSTFLPPQIFRYLETIWCCPFVRLFPHSFVSSAAFFSVLATITKLKNDVDRDKNFPVSPPPLLLRPR